MAVKIKIKKKSKKNINVSFVLNIGLVILVFFSALYNYGTIQAYLNNEKETERKYGIGPKHRQRQYLLFVVSTSESNYNANFVQQQFKSYQNNGDNKNNKTRVDILINIYDAPKSSNAVIILDDNDGSSKSSSNIENKNNIMISRIPGYKSKLWANIDSRVAQNYEYVWFLDDDFVFNKDYFPFDQFMNQVDSNDAVLSSPKMIRHKRTTDDVWDGIRSREEFGAEAGEVVNFIENGSFLFKSKAWIWFQKNFVIDTPYSDWGPDVIWCHVLKQERLHGNTNFGKVDCFLSLLYGMIHIDTKSLTSIKSYDSGSKDKSNQKALSAYKMKLQEKYHGEIGSECEQKGISWIKCMKKTSNEDLGTVPIKLEVPMPLIAIMFGATTRTMKPEEMSLDYLAPFNHALPSFFNTVEPSYKYAVVIGYDKGDPFYDTTEGWNNVVEWFQKNKNKRKHNTTTTTYNDNTSAAAASIDISLYGVRVDNVLKKPGPVFNAMAQVAYYELGADYFYRINDDTELTSTGWTSEFVSTLQGFEYVGVVGPTHVGGKSSIMTHDFVHRTHMDIFGGMNSGNEWENEIDHYGHNTSTNNIINRTISWSGSPSYALYYPPLLVDWYMDDWISRVYGESRTKKMKTVTVTHHINAHGQRYSVDNTTKNLLKSSIEEGEQKIAAYLMEGESL